MNNILKLVPLSHTLDKVIDYRGKTPGKLGSDWSTSGYRALSALNVKSSGLQNLDQIKFVDAELYKKWMKEEVKKGDILLTSEAPAGQVLYWDSEEKIVLSQRLFAIRTNISFDSKYLSYYLKSSIGQKAIFDKMSGSTVFGISAKMFDYIPVIFHDLTTQQTISSVLSALDNKIELNNKINTELEALAKLIYDYWFVQFDFPDENGNPYKSSGGEMIWDEELKRKIPGNWVCSNIFSVADLFGGGTPSKRNPKYWNGTIPFFTPTDSKNEVHCLATDEYITEEGVNNCSTQLFDKNTVFVTARGSVGRLVLNSLPMAMNQSCYALRAKSGISYTYLFFLTKQLIQHLEIRASGSVFNSIVSNDIKFSKLAIPSNLELIKMYAKITEPLFEKIELMSNENQRLLEIRNWLLPMLMNGQVKVSE